MLTGGMHGGGNRDFDHEAMATSFQQNDFRQSPTMQVSSRNGSPLRDGIRGDEFRQDHPGGDRIDRRSDGTRQFGSFGGHSPISPSTPTSNANNSSTPPVSHPLIVLIIVPPTTPSTAFTPPSSSNSNGIRDNLQTLVSSNLSDNSSSNNRSSSSSSGSLLSSNQAESSDNRITSHSLSPLASLSLLSSDLLVRPEETGSSFSEETRLTHNSDDSSAAKLDDEQPATKSPADHANEKQLQQDTEEEETLIELGANDPLARGKRKLIAPKTKLLLAEHADLATSNLRSQILPAQPTTTTRDQIWLEAAEPFNEAEVIHDDLIELIAANHPSTTTLPNTEPAVGLTQFTPVGSLEASLGYYQAGEIEGDHSPAVITPAEVAAAASLPVAEPK